jgi:hypothetical protein
MNFLPFELYCGPSYATITTGGNANGGSAADTHLRTPTIFRFDHLRIRVLNLFRFSSFGFRASAKPAFSQEKCQANPRPQRPITTLYLRLDPKTLIKKAPFLREFDPKTDPHNAPKIAIPRINPLWRPRNPTRTLEGFTEKSTATLENFPPQSFPESPAEACENPR